jgi:hypothetical protein
VGLRRWGRNERLVTPRACLRMQILGGGGSSQTPELDWKIIPQCPKLV